MVIVRRPAILVGMSMLTALPGFGESYRPIATMPDAMNAFTFRLIQKTDFPKNQNLLLSPFSVSMAMGMLIPGTQPADQTTLLNAIAPGSVQGMNAKQALSGYEAVSKQLSNSAEVSIANSAWVDSRMKLKQAYSDAIAASFSTSVSKFTHDSSSVNRINQWVSKNTKQRIPTIIDQIDGDDRLFLINAVAFTGVWAKEFDSKRTSQQDFHPIGTPAVKVPMMHMDDSVGFFKNASLRAIKLNYKGNGFSMMLVLPEKSNDASSLLKQMNPTAMGVILSGMKEDTVEIALPKFKFSNSHQLAKPLSSMGLSKLFSEADFSRISDGLKHGKIDRVIHKTFIDVDEKGTKAAAATGVVMRPTMIRVDAPTFKADRPFAFLIVHNPSKVILFAGVVNKP